MVYLISSEYLKSSFGILIIWFSTGGFLDQLQMIIQSYVLKQTINNGFSNWNILLY